MSYRLGEHTFSNRQEVEDYLAGGNDPNERPLAHNTTVRRCSNGVIEIRYHETDIVSYHPDGSVTLDSGGWKTPTTKERMNLYAPVQVWQEDSVWYVKNKHRYVRFFDGMRVGPRGGLPERGEAAEAEPNPHETKRRIREYAYNFALAVGRGEVPLPGAGDCWYCSMFDDVGEGSVDHLESHMEEEYYVPALLYRAIGKDKAPQMARYYWQRACQTGERIPASNLGYVYYSPLVKYMYTRFGIAPGRSAMPEVPEDYHTQTSVGV